LRIHAVPLVSNSGAGLGWTRVDGRCAETRPLFFRASIYCPGLSARVPRCILLAGIGLAIAKDLLAQGYTVFANGRSEERLTKAFADLSGPQRSRVM
jgi:hypothetical protein